MSRLPKNSESNVKAEKINKKQSIRKINTEGGNSVSELSLPPLVYSDRSKKDLSLLPKTIDKKTAIVGITGNAPKKSKNYTR